MKNIKLYYLFLLAFLAIGISSCDDDESLNSPILDIALGFDKTERTVLENGGSTIINVNFEAPALQSGTIVVSIQNLTASAADYSIPEAVGNQITFSVSEGDSAVGFTFIPQDNDVVDGDKTIEFSLSAESANKLNVGAFFFKQKLTISDDESPKTVNFEVDSTNIKETDTESLEVKLTFSGMVSEPSVIKISQTTTNLTSANYTLNPASSVGFIELAIPVGATEASFTVTPIDNDEVGNLDQKIVFEIASATDGVIIIGEQNTTIVSITDDESVPVEISIADLRALYMGVDATIGNYFIKGTITSNNDNVTSRNTFIQDGTAGIALRFGSDNILNLGDNVEINVRNAMFEDFNDLLQVSGIPIENIIRQTAGTAPAPRVITLAQLNEPDTYESQLVRVNGVSFVDANGTINFSANANFVITNGTETSAVRVDRENTTFLSETIPQGTGDIIGIASVFRGSSQLVPRLVSDIFTDEDGGGGGDDFTPISDIRALYDGTNAVSITEKTEIEGVVISVVGNTSSRNITIQDATAGITVRFDAAHDIKQGDIVKVNLNGGEISNFNTLVQITDVALANATVLQSNQLPEPTVITLAQLKTGNFESLVYKNRRLDICRCWRNFCRRNKQHCKQ